ncbi:hypothetical protein Psta_2874 [Pirellula staleyi DSM 6068]|uniref:Uncharacterized protein n=1 Tax=Pirellula staleyi (strain ATCC 27377 / DSM 6068 / ICPB 4128) TaxID=530564 RepID=D2R8J8_PIRSD|nr:hypothetical protein [Pirellula staleyi]ADB17539.1 hypothetical protein Psta_2874 [Pirellula staleyi DSM 6068]
MHTVELLERAIALAERMGYTVRHEWLGGAGGGMCEFGGRRYLFLDQALTMVEQLELVTSTLQNDPTLDATSAPPRVKELLGLARPRAA